MTNSEIGKSSGKDATKRVRWWSYIVVGAACSVSGLALAALPTSSTNVAVGKPVVADSVLSPNVATYAVDGVISDTSRWVSANTAGPHTLEIDLGASISLNCAHVHSGYASGSAIANAKIQYWSGSSWLDVPGAAMTGNTSTNVVLQFSSVVSASKVRLYSTDAGYVRLKELKIFDESLGGCPALATDPVAPVYGLAPKTDILINLSGYNLDKPKRFTAPLLPDGTSFTITKAGQTTPLFTGTINGHVGDFSAFLSSFNSSTPFDTGEYVISAGGKTSYPFSIGPNWIERVSYQPAIDFMVDARCYSPVSNTCTAGVGWRDSHQFSFEVSSLVQMYMSNPSAYDRMPKQIVYSFNSAYQSLGAPIGNPPDIVKMIHWGVDRIITYNNTATGNHPLFKGELAAFLYAYPMMKEYISKADYDTVKNYTFGNWAHLGIGNMSKYEISSTLTGNMFQVYTQLGTGKGQFPPGHSIVPNLMMYEVAKREGRLDAQQYFDAAYNQTQWIIDNLSWTMPETTKGQRMSEHKTMEGLAYFLEVYPSLAPPNLSAKINSWVDTMIARSANMWDFRKYSDTLWIIPPPYNEPGNVMGFPAAALAAAQVISDPVKKQRLKEMATAQIDAGFGRNPSGRHYSHDAPRDFVGVETGWYEEHNGGNGVLQPVRGVIEGSPKEASYPFDPAAALGYTEGWVAFNSAWNASLAYMAKGDTAIQVFNETFSAIPNTLAYGRIGVELKAPLNFDYANPEFGTVSIVSSTGDTEKLKVTEKSNSSFWFRNTISFSNAARADNDGVVQVPADGWFEVSYGEGVFKKKVRFKGNGTSFVRL
ncbi:discoidin domain-containing protein [Undibacterium sp. LX40W]|uniref:Discoidin domain-containing protein n=1 Tax=Undibacterium nitidum TaxID=2762298 RepID=A0A923HW28_9BURK|nr:MULTISPECIES: discoidin domain-containing protein [Undibacterium]MBC3881186.1 discoidin domain-containing protein [Undibacterium nitidum]MBC3890081.1 discoidin domain-containing protein [Undibacterium sp. LX40W]